MWEDRYKTDSYLFGTEPAAFLTQRADWFVPGTSVLSVAEGEGRNAVWLAEQGLTVTGLEYAPSAVEKASKLAKARDVSPEFVQSDVFAWDWPEAAFDIVMGIFIQFVGPDERQELFDLMVRAVKPGGLIVLHGYTPKQLDYRTGGPGKLENLYTEDVLRSELPGLTVELCETYDAELTEGAAHAGRSALIDFIARKPG